MVARGAAALTGDDGPAAGARAGVAGRRVYVLCGSGASAETADTVADAVEGAHASLDGRDACATGSDWSTLCN